MNYRTYIDARYRELSLRIQNFTFSERSRESDLLFEPQDTIRLSTSRGIGGRPSSAVDEWRDVLVRNPRRSSSVKPVARP